MQHRRGALAFACALIFAPQSAVLAQPVVTPSPSAASTPFPVPAGGTVEPFSAPAVIPFIVTDPLPLLTVSVNGHKANFFIDTGASNVVLDPAFAASAGVTLAGDATGTFAGGKHATYTHGVASQFSVGAVTLDAVPVIGLATRRFAFFGDTPVDGIIGTAFLAHFLATIDYVHGTLTLRPRTASAAFERAAAGAASVPMIVVGDHFIFVRGRINDGPEGLLSVDTGLAGGGVMPSKAAVADSNVVLDQAHAGQGMGAGGPVQIVPFAATVTVGSRRVADVTGFFSPEGDQFGIFPFPVRGAVSHGFFRGCALTLDFDAMRLVMQ